MVVAFYTIGTPYEAEVEILKESLQKFGIPHILVPVHNAGKWVVNCAMKPKVILHTLKTKCKGIDYLIYLDADAVVVKDPKLFRTFNSDFAVHARIKPTGPEVLSGTIIMRKCASVINCIYQWVAEQAKYPEKWDQKTLETILGDGTAEACRMNVVNLPLEYVKIFDDKSPTDSEPVIIHNQASRRFKAVVTKLKPVPDVIGGQRIIRHDNGSFSLPRGNASVEAKLDLECSRVHPNEKTWYPLTQLGGDISTLTELFEGLGCYIVGKGPSLDNLSISNFENVSWPIIALNEAIHKVEELKLLNPVFLLQQDFGLKRTCIPKKARVFVSRRAHCYFEDKLSVFVYQPEKYGLRIDSLSVVCAITIAKSLGTNQFQLISFDACIKGKEALAYAECVGYESKIHGDPERFLGHLEKINTAVHGSPLEFVLPE